MKTDILNYLIEANILLTVSALLYYAFLHNQHVFKIKRFYILTSLFIVLIIPFVHLNIPENGTVIISESLRTIYLDTIFIGADQASQQSSFDYIEIALIGYATIALVFFGAFAYQLFSLMRIRKLGSNRVVKQGKHTIIYMAGSYPSFSFFNTVFINSKETTNEEDRKNIIAHELIHAQQWHSLDVMLLLISRTIFWINPTVWFYKNSQQETHEYLVDQRILMTTDKSNYQSLLAQMTLNHHYSAGNFFAKNQTVKRINMMNEKLKKHSWWRTSTAIVSLAMIASIIACNDETIELIESAEMVIDIPAESQEELNRLKTKYPDEQFSYIEIDAPSERINIEDFVDNPNTIQYIEVFKSRNKIGLILANNEDFKKLVEYRKSADGVYDIVEEQPGPANGMEKFYEYLGKNMTYPAEARQNGVEGRVFVQFIVSQEGKITDSKVVKGIGWGCDKEALRVINEAEDWTPGYQRGQAVKVRMILPITFKLGEKTDPENNIADNKNSETLVVGYGLDEE